MKKIFVLLIIVLLNINICIAGSGEKDYTVNFNGNKFHLLYSVKNKDFGGYLNEYYKKGDTYNIWSELVAVHHFPNAYSPIDRIRDFKDYLGSMHVPSSLTFDDKRNMAMIDFVMFSEHNMPIVIEFNIFKYEKSKKCGSVAIQYARRYTATTTMQVEAIKSDIEKNRNKLIKKVKKFRIPEIIQTDIDKCISAADVVEQNKEEVAKEKPNKEEVIAEDKQISEGENLELASAKEEESTIALNNTKDSESAKKAEEEHNTKNKEEETPKSENADIKENRAATEDTQTNAETKSASIDAKSDYQLQDKKQELSENAPIPNITEDKNIKKTSHKNKNKKNNYEITNDKSDFIAVPRTKKELKEEVRAKKQQQKNIKIQKKNQAKFEKQQEKLNAKAEKKQAKAAKKEAKAAEKRAKQPYTVTNNNSELIAKPRTKKELKENNKQKRKEAKKRAKEAKKKLD